MAKPPMLPAVLSTAEPVVGVAPSDSCTTTMSEAPAAMLRLTLVAEVGAAPCGKLSGSETGLPVSP